MHLTDIVEEQSRFITHCPNIFSTGDDDQTFIADKSF